MSRFSKYRDSTDKDYGGRGRGVSRADSIKSELSGGSGYTPEETGLPIQFHGRYQVPEPESKIKIQPNTLKWLRATLLSTKGMTAGELNQSHKDFFKGVSRPRRL